ncbi:reverse transcriptase domain-containing protein [Pedobacter terrae]|uniref:reverse transcriptase domain-containing protein n=1 Tax=Pedobacter terrae TaxID=405671 RepID=UPI002FF7CF37
MSLNLLSQLASKGNLLHAWNLLKKDNEDSRGLSGITILQFAENLDANLEKISADLSNGTFKFQPTRAAIIKKDNGKFRPLQIPEISDRVVLKSLSAILETNFEQVLNESQGISFAYQRGLGIREAVLAMKAIYRQSGKVILKADIINFFEEVKKDSLLHDLIYPNLPDKSLNPLIAASLSQKVGGLNKLSKAHRKLFKNAGKGIPQGNPLSPILSNLYLSTFDLHMKEKGYPMIRYADDFVVVFKSEEEARTGYEEIKNFLTENYALNIHPLETNNGKTVIIYPEQADFGFLSIKFDGEHVYPSRETLGFLKGKLKQTINAIEIGVTPLSEIEKVIEKWIAIYSYTDVERYFEEIDMYVNSKLERHFRSSRYKIKKCRKLAYRVRVRQHDKSTHSFWRNTKLKDILPAFIKKIRSVRKQVSVGKQRKG